MNNRNHIFSTASSNLLAFLNPGRRPSGKSYYPKQLKNRESETIVSKSEPVADWFVRIIDTILDGDIKACEIEDNVAVFVIVKWENNRINYINFQVFITIEGNLEKFYNGFSSIKHQYFRLDLDDRYLYSESPMTSIFSEPMPHIHSIPKGPPRFFLNYRESKNIILDFIELIYLNYRYDKWLEWAQTVWRTNISRKFEEDTLSVFLEASKTNQIIPNIKKYKKDIIVFKNALKQEKEKVIALKLDNDLLGIINY